MNLMNFKKILITLSFVLCMLSLTVHAKTMQFTMGDNTAKVDEGEIKNYTMEVAPYTVEGRTMVPVRIVGEAFGADVNYIPNELKVVVKLGNKNISLVIGEDTAIVDGKTVKLDVPSVEKNGRTLVPLRFVSENLGFEVKYVSTTQQILITDEKAVFEVNGSKIYPADFVALYNMYYTEYGSDYGEDLVLSNTKLLLTDYLVYESEANKAGIPYPYEKKGELIETVKLLDSEYPGTLDAVWANLLEIESRAAELNSLLYQLYLPSAEELEKYSYGDSSTLMAAKHILVTDKKVATELYNKLKKGADFDQLMVQYTEDTGLESYPDGYVFSEGEMVAEFELATKSLRVGQISDVVESIYGYHIIKRIAVPDSYLAEMYAQERMAEHFTNIVETGDVKMDNYTDEQLKKMCK